MTLLILLLTSSLMSWLKSIFSRSFRNKCLSKWEKSRKYFVSWHRGSRLVIVNCDEYEYGAGMCSTVALSALQTFVKFNIKTN